MATSSSTRGREPGGMAAGAGWCRPGGTDAFMNRYHEHTTRSKRAAGARKEMAPAQLMPAWIPNADPHDLTLLHHTPRPHPPEHA
jgi:hypothetical protein